MVKVQKDKLLEALSKCKSATEKKSALPVLSNFLLSASSGTLTVRATDLENFLTFRIPADTLKELVVSVNASRLTEIVRTLSSNEVVLSLEEDKLHITSGRSSFKLATSDPEDFPEFPQPSEFSGEISSLLFLKAIDLIEPAISKDDTRYALQGLYIHRVNGRTHFAGSDGHRLHVYYTEESLPEMLIPRKSLKVIKTLIKDNISLIKIASDETFTYFATQDWTLACRTLEGEYPDYMAVIPSEFSFELSMNAETLLEALKRLGSVAENSTYPVRLTFKENTFRLSVEDPEYGSGEEEITLQEKITEPLEIGFNAKYLISALDGISGEITFKMVDPESATLIEPADKELHPCFFVVMPMRL